MFNVLIAWKRVKLIVLLVSFKIYVGINQVSVLSPYSELYRRVSPIYYMMMVLVMTMKMILMMLMTTTVEAI